MCPNVQLDKPEFLEKNRYCKRLHQSKISKKKIILKIVHLRQAYNMLYTVVLKLSYFLKNFKKWQFKQTKMLDISNVIVTYRKYRFHLILEKLSFTILTLYKIKISTALFFLKNNRNRHFLFFIGLPCILKFIIILFKTFISVAK